MLVQNICEIHYLFMYRLNLSRSLQRYLANSPPTGMTVDSKNSEIEAFLFKYT